jgi:hypothetical protein
VIDLRHLADPRCPPGWEPRCNVAALDAGEAYLMALATEHTIALRLAPGILLADRRCRAGCRVVPGGYTCYRKKRGG